MRRVHPHAPRSGPRHEQGGHRSLVPDALGGGYRSREDAPDRHCRPLRCGCRRRCRRCRDGGRHRGAGHGATQLISKGILEHIDEGSAVHDSGVSPTSASNYDDRPCAVIIEPTAVAAHVRPPRTGLRTFRVACQAVDDAGSGGRTVARIRISWAAIVRPVERDDPCDIGTVRGTVQDLSCFTL